MIQRYILQSRADVCLQQLHPVKKIFFVAPTDWDLFFAHHNRISINLFDMGNRDDVGSMNTDELIVELPGSLSSRAKESEPKRDRLI